MCQNPLHLCAGGEPIKPCLDDLSRAELAGLMAELGQPAYRAKQLFGWLHKAQVFGFDEMPNLPAALRAQLAQRYSAAPGRVKQLQQSRDGTAKLLVELGDGQCVETVLMHYKHGPSVCISSQVGCRMGCVFCASSVGGPGFEPGLMRNLTPGEMAGQLYLAQKQAGTRVSHLVLMGIGEPLDNYDNVMAFLRLVTDEEGQNLAGRNISLSTCGVVPGIYRLAEEALQLTLSVSLHAADDETRARLMPVNKSWPLAEVMAACRAYRAATGRRISYEYTLFDGVNDSDEDAAKLAALLKGQDAHVNLIAANPVTGSGYAPPGEARTRAFAESLQAKGIAATLRRRLGADIDAACGQLRRSQGEAGES